LLAVIYLCVMGIDSAFISTVLLFRQCGMFFFYLSYCPTFFFNLLLPLVI
jgi:hypothetical protein